MSVLLKSREGQMAGRVAPRAPRIWKNTLHIDTLPLGLGARGATRPASGGLGISPQ